MTTSVPTSPDADAHASGPWRVRARHLSKSYDTNGRKNFALGDVSLDIEAGKMVVLLGPSGCGKTTLLRSIAGLEQPQQGEIEIGGALVYSAAARKYVPPEKRNVSMVFQSYALWPHMTARQNMEYPLKSRKVAAPDRLRRVDEIADVVGLSQFLDRYPAQMSGGQQQRVALGRAIVAGSDVVLFDEPLSNVDAKVREQIRREISALQQRFGFSGLYVTHDQVEASAIADQLVIMDHGAIVQTGSPEFVYNHPINSYVAAFMGSVNSVTGTLAESPADWQGTVAATTALGNVQGVLRGDAASRATAVDVMFRPEACRFHTDEPGDTPNRWRARLKRRIPLGPMIEHLFDVGDGSAATVLIAASPSSLGAEGATGWLSVPPASTWVFPR